MEVVRSYKCLRSFQLGCRTAIVRAYDSVCGTKNLGTMKMMFNVRSVSLGVKMEQCE